MWRASVEVDGGRFVEGVQPVEDHHVALVLGQRLAAVAVDLFRRQHPDVPRPRRRRRRRCRRRSCRRCLRRLRDALQRRRRRVLSGDARRVTRCDESRRKFSLVDNFLQPIKVKAFKRRRIKLTKE